MNFLQDSFDPNADHFDQVKCQFSFAALLSKAQEVDDKMAQEMGLSGEESLLSRIHHDFSLYE